MFVKPAQRGLIVRDPKSGIPLPDNGQEVEDTSFWRRRMKDGDVIAVTENKTAKTKGDDK